MEGVRRDSHIWKIWHSKSGLEMKYSTLLRLVLYLSLAHSFCAIFLYSTCSNALTHTYSTIHNNTGTVCRNTSHVANSLLVWTAWNVVPINYDGYHVISTSTGSK